MPAGADGNLKNGSDNIDALQLGDSEVDKVYLGSNEIWKNSQPPTWNSNTPSTLFFSAFTASSINLNQYVTGENVRFSGPSGTFETHFGGDISLSSNGILSYGGTHGSTSRSVNLTVFNDDGFDNRIFTVQIG